MRNQPRGLPRGIRSLFRLPPTRDRLIREADEETRFHLELWSEELRARGLSAVDADAEARRRFGDVHAYHEYAERRAARQARWQRVADWFVEWSNDVRFALRHLSKARAFTAVTVVTLALGIGANNAIFSVVHRLLVAPLPYRNADRVVALKTIGHPAFVVALAQMNISDAPSNPSQSLMQAWAARAHSLEMIAGADQVFLSLLPDGRQDTVTHAFVTTNLLDLLGARPSFGRSFRPDEEVPGHDHVAMISHQWWQLAYGGRADVLGQNLEYEGQKYTIIGVMPPGFTMPMSPRVLDGLSVPAPDVWMPTPIKNTTIGFGLLRRGTSAEDASKELTAIANTPVGRGDGDSHQLFASKDPIRARAMRAQDFLAPRELRTIEILFAAVGALLLIACANVANLLLARGWARRREFAVRMGLGAGRARLIRLALTESALLAAVAGVIGVLIAWQGLRVIVALRPMALDSLADVQIEPAVLAWTGAISIVAGLVFGSGAAFLFASQDAGTLLRSEVRTSSSGVSRRVRSSLVVAEIALSFALLVGAGLLVRSFVALQRTPLGFDPRHLVSVDLLTGPAITRAGQRQTVRAEVARRLGEMPGVRSAAVGLLPTAGFQGPDVIVVDGPDGMRPVPVSQHMMTWIDSNYFRATGIAIILGRAPHAAASDEPAPRPTPGTPYRTLSEEVVVSRSLATRITPDGRAVGLGIRLLQDPRRPAQGTDDWSTIVGVSDDVHLPGSHGDLWDFQLYTLPVMRMPEPTFVVRFGTVPPNVESALRDAMHEVDPRLIARRARVADDYVREALAPTRFTLALLGAFAGVALVIAIVGLYGSIAYTVSQRTREIGIRIALGATPSNVNGLVLGDGVRLAALGLIIGLGVAVLSTRALSSLLYSVQAGDPLTFAAIALLVAGVAVAASYVPAARAARVDPVDALRAE
jgi:putative ABC transport system permease protein